LQLLNSPWYPSMFLQVDDIIPYGGWYLLLFFKIWNKLMKINILKY
jgi:hypothetical protein